MDLSRNDRSEVVADLATQLLSRDPVVFNAAINAKVAPDAVYRGHGLEIHGASNIKHAAWLWHLVNVAQSSAVKSTDIEWDNTKSTATLRSLRQIRIRPATLVGVSMPISMRIHLTGKGNGKEAYVDSIEEDWIVEGVLARLPGAARIHDALVKKVWTAAFLAVSNTLFAAHAHMSSHGLVQRVRGTLPAGVADGIDAGFTEGASRARGWGHLLSNAACRLTYPFFALSEATLQSGTLFADTFAPISLPYPYIFDAHCIPPRKAAVAHSQKPSLKATPNTEKSAAKTPSPSSPPTQDSASFAPTPAPAEQAKEAAPSSETPIKSKRKEGKSSAESPSKRSKEQHDVTLDETHTSGKSNGRDGKHGHSHTHKRGESGAGARSSGDAKDGSAVEASAEVPQEPRSSSQHAYAHKSSSGANGKKKSSSKKKKAGHSSGGAQAHAP